MHYVDEKDPLPKKEVRLNLGEAELRHGHLEAWANILQSYQAHHPDHIITLFYHNNPAHNLVDLIKKTPHLDPKSFKLVVEAEDEDFSDVGKLARLLAEGSTEHYKLYIGKEIFQIMRLF